MRLKRIVAAVLAALLLALSCPAAWGQGGYAMPYYIEVDISNQIVTVYDTATGEIVRQMLCSTGLKDATPTGDFVMPNKERRDERSPWYQIGNCYVRYASRIIGPVLFHSIPYTRRSQAYIDAEQSRRFGFPASHGCVRLRWQDALFIAENCLPGTRVRIYKSGEYNEALRELLFQESYDASSGFSYEYFLGIPSEPGELGRSSQGRRVLNLQYRLHDLGLYDGEINGVYDSATVNAVRMAQYLMGEDMSGVASVSFQSRVYQADAPTAMNVRLSEGMSGPAVRVLQENLMVLKLYDEAPDSVYDAPVTEAVRRFEQAYGYEEDGVAAPVVQKAIAYEAARVRDAFGDAPYTCRQTSDPLTLAEVTTSRGAKLREGPSQNRRQVKRLAQGATLIVLEAGESWSRVRSGEDSGYVKNSLIRAYEQPCALLRYTSEDEREYTIGRSAADYAAAGQLPREVFEAYLEANDQQVTLDRLVTFATVDTRGEGDALNLRRSPGSDGEVLATIANGERLRVTRRFSEWTQVTYGDLEGYLLNRYLNFWTGPEDALDEALEDSPIDPSMVAYALVVSAAEKGAPVYEDDDEESAVLGHLKSGAKVETVEMSGSWCLISYQGHSGYMTFENLQLVMKNEPPAA